MENSKFKQHYQVSLWCAFAATIFLILNLILGNISLVEFFVIEALWSIGFEITMIRIKYFYNE